MANTRCYSPTCSTNKGPTPSPSSPTLGAINMEHRRQSQTFSDASGSDPIDKVRLQKLEIHFFYPFFIINPKKHHRTANTFFTFSPKKAGDNDDIDALFGNDGHLLFEERISAKRVEQMNLLWADELLKRAKAEKRGASLFGFPLRPPERADSSLESTVKKAHEAEKARMKKRGSIKQIPFESPLEYDESKTEISIVVTDSDTDASTSKGNHKKNDVEMQPLAPKSGSTEYLRTGPEPQTPKPKVHSLPATLNLKGASFTLDDVFVCQYNDSIGILRFAVSSHAPVGVQMTLDLINGLMRLQEEKVERPSVMKDGKKLFTFHPLVFVESILEHYYGEKGTNWEADKETDRMFVYSMGIVSEVNDSSLVQKVVYKISQMEDDARAVVDQGYLDEFASSENVYKRFANKEGGIWSTFHVDGGSTLIFAEPKEAKDIPIYTKERLEKKKKIIHGSSRPLVGYSLNELLIFRRMFLRRINQELDELIVESKSNRHTLMKIRGIHLRGLRFRAKFTAAKVSTTRAGKEQFLQWDSVMGMDNLQGRLQDTLSQLNEYYSGIEEKANQKHIDILTIVLGCLGAISVVNDLTTYYTNTERSIGAAYYLPGGGLAFFMLVAIAFIWWIRS